MVYNFFFFVHADSPVPDMKEEHFMDLGLTAIGEKKEEMCVEPYDHACALFVSGMLVRYAVYHVCFFGLLANIVVLWVWSSELAYRPTTYLFKALAVSDILSLVSLIIGHIMPRRFFTATLFCWLNQATRMVGVQITLLLAVARVIRVFLPLRSEQLLPRVRLKAVLVGFVLWSLSVQLVENYLRTAQLTTALGIVDLYFGDGLGFIAPSVLQVTLMLAVMCRVWRSVRVESPPSHRPAVAFQQETHKARRLCYTVFTMSVFTFLAYGLGFGVATFIKRRSTKDDVLSKYRLVVLSTVGLMCVINSTVNVFIYYVFTGKFKAVLVKKLRGGRQSFKSPSFFFSGTALPGGQNGTTNPDGAKIVIHEEVSKDVTKSKLPACSFEKTAGDAEIPPSTARKGVKEESGSFKSYI